MLARALPGIAMALCLSSGVARSKYVGWTDMASAELEPITGVWRQSNTSTPPPV